MKGKWCLKVLSVFSVGFWLESGKYARIRIISRPCVQTASSGPANVNYA